MNAEIAALRKRIDDLEKNEDYISRITGLQKEIAELKKDFWLEVAKGNVAGHFPVNKYGGNTEIATGTTADIWSRGAVGGTLIWVAPTAARTHTIASTDANDTTGGTGARTVQVYGLTDWNTHETSEIVTMDTATPPTTGAFVIIHRMRVLTTGSGSLRNIGLITATATTDGTVTAEIPIGEGQTLMAIYGVPSTETLYLNDISAEMGKTAGGTATASVDLDLLVNCEPQTQLLAFTHKHHFGLAQTGTSGIVIPFPPPKKIEGPAIVKIQADSLSNGMDVSAWFNGATITNEF